MFRECKLIACFGHPVGVSCCCLSTVFGTLHQTVTFKGSNVRAEGHTCLGTDDPKERNIGGPKHGEPSSYQSYLLVSLGLFETESRPASPGPTDPGATKVLLRPFVHGSCCSHWVSPQGASKGSLLAGGRPLQPGDPQAEGRTRRPS